MQSATSLIVAMAGLMGLTGVTLAAAGAHLGGGELTRLAAEFLLLHAATMVGMMALAHHQGWIRGSRLVRPLLLASAGSLGVATLLFSGDLALAGLWNWHPLPMAAPIGGIGMILAWAGLTVAGLLQSRAL